MSLFGPPNIKKMVVKGDVNGLIKVFENSKVNTEIRLAAARALGELRDPQALQPLIAALKPDRFIDWRLAAAGALGELGDQRSVGPLVDAMDMGLGSSAGDALVKICGGSPGAASDAALRMILVLYQRGGGRVWRGSEEIGKGICDYIGRLGNQDVVAKLLEYIGTCQIRNDFSLYPFQYEAKKALGKIIAEKEVELLDEALNGVSLNDQKWLKAHQVWNPHYVKIAAADYLGTLKDPGAALALRKALKREKSGEVHEAVKNALKSLKDK